MVDSAFARRRPSVLPQRGRSGCKVDAPVLSVLLPFITYGNVKLIHATWVYGCLCVLLWCEVNWGYAAGASMEPCQPEITSIVSVAG